MSVCLLINLNSVQSDCSDKLFRARLYFYRRSSVYFESRRLKQLVQRPRLLRRNEKERVFSFLMVCFPVSFQNELGLELAAPHMVWWLRRRERGSARERSEKQDKCLTIEYL